MAEEQARLLEKIEQLELRSKYPGVSCSKPQDRGCFQNMFGARECEYGMHCTTVDAENNIYRCKTPSIMYTFGCQVKFFMIWLMIGVVIGVVIIAFLAFIDRMKKVGDRRNKE